MQLACVSVVFVMPLGEGEAKLLLITQRKKAKKLVSHLT